MAKKESREVKGVKGFTKNDGLNLSCAIIFHTLGYREIDNLECSRRERKEGKTSE
jgi:hypothetical protein